MPEVLEILARQMGSPVQFVRGLRRLYDAGARVFVEVGPKKALQGFADDVLGGDAEVLPLFTNHPKFGDIGAFNQAVVRLVRSGSRRRPSNGGSDCLIAHEFESSGRKRKAVYSQIAKRPPSGGAAVAT